MVRNLNIFIWEVWSLPRCLGQGQMGIGSLVHSGDQEAPTTPVCTGLQAGGIGSLGYRNHFPSGALEGDLFSMGQSSNPHFSQSSLSSILLFSLIYLVLIQWTAVLASHSYPSIFLYLHLLILLLSSHTI